jgi:Na+-transporting NADH:ubiquinone oxidoreductase subunit F
MSQQAVIILSMVMFTGIVLVLVAFILAARSKLVAEGQCHH